METTEMNKNTEMSSIFRNPFICLLLYSHHIDVVFVYTIINIFWNTFPTNIFVNLNMQKMVKTDKIPFNTGI